MEPGPDPTPLLIGTGILGLLAITCLIIAYRVERRRRLLVDLPTSRTQGVFIGLVELEGTAESEAPLTSHLGGKRCVDYVWDVSEHWSRIVTETYTDKDGKTRTRTRRESGWKIVAHGGETQDFWLRDETGVVLIRPAGAEVDRMDFFSHTCGRDDPLYYAKGPAHAVAHSDHRRRFTESGIALHSPLYVVGHARERSDTVAAEVAAPPKDAADRAFILSTRGQRSVIRGRFWSLVAGSVLGAAMAGGTALLPMAILPGTAGIHPGIAFAIGAAVYLLLSGAAWVVLAFNSLISLRRRVDHGWSLIDIQLKRRHDLIRNLVAAVDAAATHERGTQESLTALRTQLDATPPGQPGPDPSGVARKVIALREAYPRLTADDAFLRLQRELSDTEQRIALARGYFNDLATNWNTRLETVPDALLARAAGFQPRPLLHAEGFEREAVKVSLAD